VTDDTTDSTDGGGRPRVPPAHIAWDIRSVAAKIGHPPTSTEYREHGVHSVQTARDRFGSHPAAVEAAGLEPTGQGFSKLDYVRDLRHVACELGVSPSSTEYSEYGKYDATSIIRRFGSYEDGLRAAGIDPQPDRRGLDPWISDDELIEDLYVATATLGRPPSKRDIMQLGEHSPTTYYRRIAESWAGVLEAAGLDDYDPEDPPDSVREYQQLLGVSGEDRS